MRLLTKVWENGGEDFRVSIEIGIFVCGRGREEGRDSGYLAIIGASPQAL